MSCTIIKRDGREVNFDKSKIENAILKAFNEVDGEITPFAKEKAANIADYIEKKSTESDEPMGIEQIQDLVENGLMSTKRKDVARSYIIYRNRRSLARKNTMDDTINEYLGGENEYWNTENSNKDAKVLTTQRDYLAGILSTDYSRRYLLPEDIVRAHDEGIIHFHDIDYFAENAITNCCLINLEDMLQNGTVVNGVMIEKPHKFSTAATIATQIILGVSSSQYGGCTITLTHLAPFVRDSFIKYLGKAKEYIGNWDDTLQKISDREIWNGYEFIKENYPTVFKYAMGETNDEIKAGVQTFNYQVNSMTNTNGQSPFLSVNMYLDETEEYREELAMIIEEFLNQRILGFKNEKGVYVTPAFPKLLYVLDEDNIYPDSKYYYLTELAAKCTAKRMVPDYISAKEMRRLKNGDVYPCMGCRSFLTPDTEGLNPDGSHKYYGRFNMGVVTISLPDVALSSGGDFDKFWKIYDERLELCHRALQCRYKRLSKVTSDVAPLLWQNGAFARLPKHASIDPLLHNNYCTISLGYAGLYECVKYMTGHSHSDNGEGHEFALQVMKHLNDKASQWRAEENISYSVYGTPIESTTYKFAKNLQRRFGIIPGITDRNYITNSVHIPVFEKIDAFTKLKLEAEFQPYSPGGYISYIESPNMQDNIPALLEVIKFIYDNCMYAEINSKSDYCMVCGYDGEIKIVKESKTSDRLVWECPCCGNRDQDKMSVARRVCGYISSHYFNQGRTQEIAERVLHLD